MDNRIEQAFQVANYMATLSNRRRIILEEFNQKIIHYVNGGTFKITPELISFTKTVLDLGHEEDVAFVDSNNFPVIVNDVRGFFNTIVEIYFRSVNEYAANIADLKLKRKIEDIVNL